MRSPEENIRLSIEAYKTVYPGSKPTITTKVFQDKTLQLFLCEPDTARGLSAMGSGTVLEEAAENLRESLVKRLTELYRKSEADHAQVVSRHVSFTFGLDAALNTLH
jgi:hypothetical protein